MDVRPSSPSDRTAVVALLDEARRCDGREPLSEQKRLDLTEGGPGSGFVAVDGGAVVGYAHAVEAGAAWEVESVLAPSFRGRPQYAALAGAVLAGLGARRAVHLWASQPEHIAALEGMGLEHFRELRQMRRRLPAPGPGPLPDGVHLAGFEVGRDEEAWLAVYRRAFAEHPEGAGWDGAELARRFARDWFDAADVLMAWDGPAGDDLAAFCWTKVHDDELGEIYIIGVDPGHQGRGLGKLMVLAGLDHLHRARGSTMGMLYVDAENGSAVRLYSSLGFRPVEFSRCFLA